MSLIAGALVIGALIAFAIVEQARIVQDQGATLTVALRGDEATQVDGQYLVPFTVTNTGSTALLSADIAVEVFQGERLVGSTTITVTFLPLKGRQHGLVASGYDPRASELRWRLQSLQLP